MADISDLKSNRHVTAKETKSDKSKSDRKDSKDAPKDLNSCFESDKTPVVSALTDNRPKKVSPPYHQNGTPIVSALENSKNNRFGRKTRYQNEFVTSQNWQQKSTGQKKNANNYSYHGYPQNTRIFPSQRYRNRGSRREEDDSGSRCSTPSSTSSVLSNGSVDLDLNDRDSMPPCKIVAEGGEGLPLMQVSAPNHLLVSS